MQTTTYKCDRCGAEDATNALALQEVTIGLRRTGYSMVTGGAYTYTDDHGRDSRPRVEWCRKCLVETGILPRHPSVDAALPVPPPPPSLEDMVREIVREELAQAQQ